MDQGPRAEEAPGQEQGGDPCDLSVAAGHESWSSAPGAGAHPHLSSVGMAGRAVFSCRTGPGFGWLCLARPCGPQLKARCPNYTLGRGGASLAAGAGLAGFSEGSLQPRGPRRPEALRDPGSHGAVHVRGLCTVGTAMPTRSHGGLPLPRSSAPIGPTVRPLLSWQETGLVRLDFSIQLCCWLWIPARYLPSQSP